MGNGSFLPPSKWDDFFKCGYPGKIMNHEMEGSLLSEDANVLMDVEQMNSSRLPGVKPAMEKRFIHPTYGCHWKWGDKPLPVRIYHSNLQLVVSPWNFWLVMCVWPKGHILWFQWEFWAEKSTTCEHWKSLGRIFMIPMVPSITTCLACFFKPCFGGSIRNRFDVINASSEEIMLEIQKIATWNQFWEGGFLTLMDVPIRVEIPIKMGYHRISTLSV